MSGRDRDINWAIARLTRNHNEQNARIAEIFKEKGLTWDPPITVWDVNDPKTLTRVCDGFELQMMGIRP